MAGYDSDWRDRARSRWSGRRGRAWSGAQGSGYGADYRGRGYAHGTEYRAGSEADFGSDSRFERGEYGRPVNTRGFGTRGSWGTPDRFQGSEWRRGWSSGEPGGRAWRRAWSGPAEWGAGERGRGWETGYGGEYEGGRYSVRSRRGRATGYGPDFSEFESGRGGYATDFRMGAERDEDDFGGREHRHYGHTPVDRWPSDASRNMPAHMSDDDVIESVRENLFQDSFVDPERIHVTASDGVVTLSGEVDDFLETRYAWDDAWESPGVRGVINDLTVRTDRAPDETRMPQASSAERGRRERGSR